MWCRTFSFAGRSMIRLWIRISNRSKVAVPSPHGDFLVVTLSFFVGNGIGPPIVIPERFAKSFIDPQILLSISMSVLFSFTLTLGMGKYVEVGF